MPYRPEQTAKDQLMSQDILIERFFETLISGHRAAARQIVDQTVRAGVDPRRIVTDLFWPTYEMIERLYRGDQLSKLSHHLASRLLRVLVDQNALRLNPITDGSGAGRRVLAVCGPRDTDELGAQMAVDLLEQSGFLVSFAGGNIPNDEILQHVNEGGPDVLLMFASGSSDLPSIRQLMDTLQEIGARPDLQIVLGGGVFNRADGLAEEMGADLWAKTPMELVEVMVEEQTHRAIGEQRTVGRRRKVRREAA
jgi:MerR family transcriptional regulator, light-induced transcriptional regulator